jgi:hypothetical protein
LDTVVWYSQFRYNFISQLLFLVHHIIVQAHCGIEIFDENTPLEIAIRFQLSIYIQVDGRLDEEAF